MGNEKNRIGVIAPYFGNLPTRFDLWLKGAAQNRDIDFHLVGNCFDYLELPQNVFRHVFTFQDLNNLIVERLGGRPLVSPYKLCDLKPTYSILFSEIVEGYSIWGFSDLDLVLGDISGSVNFSDLPEDWGRVFDFGHLSFFPNHLRIFEITLFRADTWPFIRDSRLVWVFDEHYQQGLGGVNGRLEDAGYRVLGLRERFSDVMPWYRGFFDREKGASTNLFFLWSEGKMWRFSRFGNDILREETGYVHLQKREYQIQENGENTFFITPKHWNEVRSIEEGIIALKDNFDKDREPYLSQKMSLQKKARKIVFFGFEVLTVTSGLTAFAALVKSLLARERRRWFRQ